MIKHVTYKELLKELDMEGFSNNLNLFKKELINKGNDVKINRLKNKVNLEASHIFFVDRSYFVSINKKED